MKNRRREKLDQGRSRGVVECKQARAVVPAMENLERKRLGKWHVQARSRRQGAALVGSRPLDLGFWSVSEAVDSGVPREP